MARASRIESAPGARGVSLAEVLVSITVLALAATIAMVMYDGARRSFKLGDNSSEQQQIVRIAFDMLTKDLRMAGFNANPDGPPLRHHRPDEQIEGAWDTAITIRYDFDAELATASTPESSLASTAYPVVSTGNDEIVTYALANAASSGSFDLEVDYQPAVRDGIVELVTIGGVAVVQDDPPYTLYRITLNPDGSLQRTPLIDNVRSLRFAYHGESGAVLPAIGGTDDLDKVQQRQRGDIRRITLAIEGLTRDSDPRWSDPDDPVPGPGDRGEYRKFKLVGDVTPRNLGLFGVKDLEAQGTPPSTPPPPSLEPGHCNGLYAVWAPNPPQDEIAHYELRWGTTSGALNDGPLIADGPEAYLYGLTTPTLYYVTVAAVDDSGNISDPSVEASATTLDLNTLERPAGFTATTALSNRIELAWESVDYNAGPLPHRPQSDPERPHERDRAGYQLYRGTGANFTHTVGSPYDGPLTGLARTDDQVVNCRDYYYRLRAVDACDEESDPTDPAVHGKTSYFFNPRTPLNVQAFWEDNGARIRLRWDPVDRSTNGDPGEPIHIENYRVYRTGQMPVGSVPAEADFVFHEAIDDGETEFTDQVNIVNPLVSGVHFYRVTAHDDCVNESDPSAIAEPTCTFTGEVVFLNPPPNGWSPTVSVDIIGGSGGSAQVDLVYASLQGGGVYFDTQTSAPPWTFFWPGAATQSGLWQLTATVTLPNTCQQATTLVANRP